MDSYSDGLAVAVGIQFRRHADGERGRGAGCKWWLLENVMFPMATDSPSHAPTHIL